MNLKNRAQLLIAAILVAGVVVMGGLHFFAEKGQFTPASATGGGTKSDQRDPKIDGSSGQPRTGGQPAARP